MNNEDLAAMFSQLMIFFGGMQKELKEIKKVNTETRDILEKALRVKVIQLCHEKKLKPDYCKVFLEDENV